MSVILHRKGTALRSVGERLHFFFLTKKPPQNHAPKHVIIYIFSKILVICSDGLHFSSKLVIPKRCPQLKIGFVSIGSWLTFETHLDSFSEAQKTVHKQDTDTWLLQAVIGSEPLIATADQISSFHYFQKKNKQHIKVQFVTARF